jgi:hypothetical protein
MRAFGGGEAVKRVDPVLVIGVLALALAPCALLASPSDLDDLARSLGGPRGGEIVVEQLPTRLGGFGSDTAFRDYVGRPIWSQIADDILLTQTISIGHIEWYGFYGGYLQDHNPPTGDETMRVRFYAARTADGLPGQVLYEETFLNPLRSATGAWVGADVDAPEYLFEVDLSSPMALATGTPYWLEIVQIGDLESHFRWEAGYGALPQHATFWSSLPEWQYNPGSQAFRLSSIPEPATLAFLALGAMFLAKPRYGKEVSYDKLMERRAQS